LINKSIDQSVFPEKLAKTIIAQLKAGESFAELAAKHSQDTGSKDTSKNSLTLSGLTFTSSI
jgi:hypothetical protein